MNDDLPRPSRASLWIPVCAVGTLCLAGEMSLFPRRQDPAAIWIGGAYLTCCLILLSQALSWRRVHFTREGVRHRGFLTTKYIPFRDARMRQLGPLFEIYSGTDRIRVNPAVFSDRRQLIEFLADRIAGASK
jgi:hypothetical protein